MTGHGDGTGQKAATVRHATSDVQLETVSFSSFQVFPRFGPLLGLGLATSPRCNARPFSDVSMRHTNVSNILFKASR